MSESQTVWIQIRTDILSVLIWIQTVWKGYKQLTKVIASKERVRGKSKSYMYVHMQKAYVFHLSNVSLLNRSDSSNKNTNTQFHPIALKMVKI